MATRRSAPLAAALVTLVVALAACSSDGSSDRPSDSSSDVSSDRTDPSASAGRGPTLPAPADTSVDEIPAASSSDSSSGAVESTVPVDAVLPEGFTTVTVQVVEPDGEVCEFCMWLADTSDERSRGLTDMTHLGDPVGMVFVYPEPSDNRFLMYRAPMPLSIGWFDESGAFLGAADMDPCLDRPRSECPRFTAPAPFTVAIEAPRGALDDLGIVAGSSVGLVPGSEGDDCVQPSR